jgi:exopolysaccharide biosynthesis predicted pyruvyltransferase EpsI
MREILESSPLPRLYMANPGNLGDAVIRQGTLKYFNEIDLTYEEVVRPPKGDIGTFIYGGGGAWCRNWNNGRYVNTALSRAKKVIVLPSTYAIHSPLFSESNIHFFARDSLDSLGFCPMATYHQDMAFHLSSVITPSKGNGVGCFMRTDKESARLFDIPRDNKDISLLGKTYSNTENFIEAIKKVRVVHTDRLHVAIVACMLGKKIFFYQGNYFKNKAVYLSTMKGKYDVTFREPHSS